MLVSFRLLIVLVLVSIIMPAFIARPRVAQAAIDGDLAAQYFKEANDLTRRDGGRLWGISLAGPMLFVDQPSRSIVCNQADHAGKLHQVGEVFTGVLPDDVNIANTATNWAGVKWTMIAWPLPTDRRNRLRLMAHELFHRIQDRLNLESPDVSNRHLDSQEGRTWLRLEWRALERALQERGVARRQAIADAIYFRRYRQSLFAGSDAEERGLETQEGLAEYTGLKLSARSDGELASMAGYELRKAALNQSLNQSFTRSFAYTSGPAYGALLDASGIAWRNGLRAGADLSVMLQRAFAVKLLTLSSAGALARAASYDGDEVIAGEKNRESLRASRTAAYRSKLLEGPVLTIGVAGSFNYSFDPNTLVPLGDVGDVYPTMRVTDDWGILEVSNGALLIRNGANIKQLNVAAPTDPQSRPLQGPGWKLELKTGWTLEPAPRKGDFVLRRDRS